jgi:hypothetical protein
MELVSDLQTLVSRLGPVIHAPDRLAALERAGMLLDAAIPQEVREALSADPLGSEGRRVAATVAGPTVPISFTTGTTALLQSEPRTIGGFDVVGTVFLSSFEEILAKLWEALVYPQDIPPDRVAQLFGVELLRSCFTGVPDDAEIGPMLLPAPPRLRVAAPDAVDLVQPLRAQLLAPGGEVMELVADATVRVPLAMLVKNPPLPQGQDPIVALDVDKILETKVSLVVDAGSDLQPIDAARLEAFAAEISFEFGFGLREQLSRLSRSPVFEVPGGFTDSKLRITGAQLWLSTSDQGDLVTFGMQVEPEPLAGPPRDHPPAADLAPFARLFRPNTIAIIVSESLVERGLRAVAASGQLADRFNKLLEFLRFLLLPHRIAVDDVDVRFDAGAIKVGIDARLLDACAFATDYNFRATVDLRPETLNGQLRLTSNGIDINLDNTDAVLCALTSPQNGPWGPIAMTLGAGIAAVLSFSFNQHADAFWQGQRLPDSDVFPRIDLRAVGFLSVGGVDLFGTFSLAPDEISTFVTTQVLAVSETTGEVTVVESARVELSELGLPAPAGDDYVPPRDSTGEREEADGTRVKITRRGRTFPDVVLAADTSERHGLARFAVLLDDVGGLVNVTEQRITPGGATFTIRSQEVVRGDAPDLAANVAGPDGTLWITRKPIKVNLAERRLGTVQEPIRLVYVERCVAERRAVIVAEATVASIQADLEALHRKLAQAHLSEKQAVLESIRLTEQALTRAIAAVEAARAAREACVAASRLTS